MCTKMLVPLAALLLLAQPSMGADNLASDFRDSEKQWIVLDAGEVAPELLAHDDIELLLIPNEEAINFSRLDQEGDEADISRSRKNHRNIKKDRGHRHRARNRHRGPQFRFFFGYYGCRYYY